MNHQIKAHAESADMPTYFNNQYIPQSDQKPVIRQGKKVWANSQGESRIQVRTLLWKSNLFHEQTLPAVQRQLPEPVPTSNQRAESTLPDSGRQQPQEQPDKQHRIVSIRAAQKQEPEPAGAAKGKIHYKQVKTM